VDDWKTRLNAVNSGMTYGIADASSCCGGVVEMMIYVVGVAILPMVLLTVVPPLQREERRVTEIL